MSLKPGLRHKLPGGVRVFGKRALQAMGRLLTPQLMGNPNVAAKMYAYTGDANGYAIPAPIPTVERDATGLPVPPPPLRIGGPTTENYLSSALRDVTIMRRVLSDAGFTFPEACRVLELGCSSGRLTRHFADVAPRCEFWGCDLSTEHVVWAQEYLRPPFQFLTNTTYPHLPFEDRYFDLVYAGSVFSHIDDLADAWFLELRRVLKPGGLLYVTILDNVSVEVQVGRGDKAVVGSRGLAEFRAGARMFTIGRSIYSHVYYDRTYLTDHLSHVYETVSVTDKAYSELQRGYLFRRR